MLLVFPRPFQLFDYSSTDVTRTRASKTVTSYDYRPSRQKVVFAALYPAKKFLFFQTDRFKSRISSDFKHEENNKTPKPWVRTRRKGLHSVRTRRPRRRRIHNAQYIRCRACACEGWDVQGVGGPRARRRVYLSGESSAGASLVAGACAAPRRALSCARGKIYIRLHSNETRRSSETGHDDFAKKIKRYSFSNFSKSASNDWGGYNRSRVPDPFLFPTTFRPLKVDESPNRIYDAVSYWSISLHQLFKMEYNRRRYANRVRGEYGL